MAFLSIHHLPGEADRLLGMKQAHMDPVVNATAAEYGAVMSITAMVDDGLITVNVWESVEGAQAFTAHKDVQAAQRASGLPQPDRFERYEHASITDYRR